MPKSEPKSRDAAFKLTPARRTALTNALFAAYYRGWDGKDMSPRGHRPWIDGWSRAVDRRTTAHFESVGLVKSLRKGKAIWYLYLTPLGLKLAHEVYADDRGAEPSDEAAAALAAEEKHADELDRKVKRASTLLRGLKLRPYEGLKPEAISTIIRHRRVRDGFRIELKLDQLIELGEQIEKLRD